MPWQFLILLWVLILIAHSVVFKKITDLQNKTKRQYWMYAFCFLLSVSFTFYNKEPVFTFVLLLIGIIGISNSLAVFCQWRATAISQSKSSIFAQLKNLITITLGYFLINESRFLNPTLAIGVLLCFIAATIFILTEYQKGNKDEETNAKKLKSSKSLALLGWVISYSVIWGIIEFFIRIFAINGISFSQFLLGWYGGSLLGSTLLLLTIGKKEINFKLPKKKIFDMLWLALFTWLALLIAYLIVHHAPLIITQPIFMLGSTIIPFLTGLIIFKETKDLTKTGIFAILIGIIGSIIIIFGF